jgi:hypothetical protein
MKLIKINHNMEKLYYNNIIVLNNKTLIYKIKIYN